MEMGLTTSRPDEAEAGETRGDMEPHMQSLDTRSIEESNMMAATQSEASDGSRRPLTSETTRARTYESFPAFESHDDRSVKSGCGVCRVILGPQCSSAVSSLRKVLDVDSWKKKKKKKEKEKQGADSNETQGRPHEDSGHLRATDAVGAWFSTRPRSRSRSRSRSRTRSRFGSFVNIRPTSVSSTQARQNQGDI
ncbi:hypothetical protein SODALDRAFT_331019 [Sodiomyces alkalinus F11]|uniref:Uncharacterized protein n=1 Tax=Sodiomyces alkalinus (strain CBS 110278 / VKM F-3762 / F11) TaxID=1314773 RepID=A0A3N2Q3Q3_SODAK|nr:hypothetical protein SODALDRAFT_331019 [Sodiomyces alkalinus F11]ROT41298.1 hypothetical protein SODALDRAFT_331019 [Sodiomyces alkalinus F11]